MKIIGLLREKTKGIYFPYLLSILWTLVICYLSLARMPDKDKIPTIPHFDKVVHFSMYYIYTTLILLELKAGKSRFINLLIACYTICFGILMEFLQQKFFPYRSGDIFDALFNSSGAIAALLLIPFARKITKP